jgi:hypothetical protein
MDFSNSAHGSFFFSEGRLEAVVLIKELQIMFWAYYEVE